MPIQSPIASALFAAVALLLTGGAAAASPRSAGPAAVTRRERVSALAGPIAAAHSSLERLRKDRRRRKYRDGWEAIARELEAAVKRAPGDPRADEARLLCARIGEELWSVSRSLVDARAAVARDMAIDEVHPGSEAGRTGLVSAVRLAHRAQLSKELAQAAKRLLHYPRTSEVAEALALAPAGAGEHAAARAEPPSGEGLAARAATSSDRAAARPVDDEESEQDSRGAPLHRADAESGAAKETGRDVAAATHPARSSLRTERAGRGAPASPEREPDTDVPASAARVLDAIVQAARAQGASDLLGDEAQHPPTASSPAIGAADRTDINHLSATQVLAPRDQSAKDPDPTVRSDEASTAADARAAGAADKNASGEAADKPPEPTRDARPGARSAEEEGADEAGLPEPELADEAPAPHRTLASAPREFETPSDPAVEQRARDLRKSMLTPAAGSMAAQLGLKVRKVVVDAGHGGRDTGAIGPHGLREKDVTLTIARKLAQRLRAAGLEAVLTRDSDAYVSLNERTRTANEAGADLFISVHCNAARRRKLSGVETWTLNVSADRYAQRLASFENADSDASASNLRLILADLATKANASDARELAETVQSSMVKTLRPKMGKVKDNGVKQALFYVLLGTHMPSILVETAFLSNPDEEKRLRSARYQDGTADAIAHGVKQFIDARRELARAP